MTGAGALLALQRNMRAWLEREDHAAADRLGVTEAGLGVYQNNYRAQLAGVLETSFPCTLAWIGGEAFHDAVVTHVDRVPPHSWTLDAYPRDFPETLALLYADDPEVAELAAIELALGDAFVAADAAPIDRALLADVDWDHAVIELAPSLNLIDVRTNAAAIWLALIQEETPPGAEMLPQEASVLVWRRGETSEYRSIEAGERQALLAVRAGHSFAAMCEAVVALHGTEEGIHLAGQYLGQWLADDLVIGLRDARD